MLPTYANDIVHHRHGQPSTSYSGRAGPNTLLHAIPRQRRAVFNRILQVALILLVLLPLTLLMPNYAPWNLLQASRRRADFASDAEGGDGGAEEGGAGAEHAAHRQQRRQDQALADASASGAASGGRKMMTEAIPLPGAHLKHLVLVAGHAVYVGRDYSEANLESSWFLEDYQKVPGEAASFLEHIELGIKEAAADPEAMLLFSGGQTRLAAGPRSEGLSYWVVAEAAGWFNVSGVRNRTFTEEHARDSFENLLFSLCRFYELSGHYPDMVTVVSYNLKKRRFHDLHRAALRFPVARFKFVGNEVPPQAKGAQEGEARTVEAFKSDMYGCGGDLLQKKLRRDPFAVGPPHPSRCPALKGLLAHCGSSLYPGKLPWA